MHFSSGFLLVIIVTRWHQMAGFIFVIMGSVKGLSNGHQAITGTNSYQLSVHSAPDIRITSSQLQSCSRGPVVFHLVPIPKLFTL